MDATAQRALLYSRPKHRDVDVLSSLLVGDDEYVQRFRVCDPETGEVSILTLRMALDERLAPDYKSAVVVRHWTVRSVVGESESPDDDREDATEVTSARKLRPQARRSPETVADAHIAALRESDAATAALYFRTAAGARGLAAAVEAGRLAPLMDPDARLDVLRSAQLSADAHARVVRATTRATGKEGAAFVVVLGRDANGAWGVDATAPVPAADLRRWKPPRRREEGRGARKRGGIRQEGRRGEREEEYAGVLGVIEGVRASVVVPSYLYQYTTAPSRSRAGVFGETSATLFQKSSSSGFYVSSTRVSCAGHSGRAFERRSTSRVASRSFARPTSRLAFASRVFCRPACVATREKETHRRGDVRFDLFPSRRARASARRRRAPRRTPRSS